MWKICIKIKKQIILLALMTSTVQTLSWHLWVKWRTSKEQLALHTFPSHLSQQLDLVTCIPEMTTKDLLLPLSCYSVLLFSQLWWATLLKSQTRSSRWIKNLTMETISLSSLGWLNSSTKDKALRTIWRLE